MCCSPTRLSEITRVCSGSTLWVYSLIKAPARPRGGSIAPRATLRAGWRLIPPSNECVVRRGAGVTAALALAAGELAVRIIRRFAARGRDEWDVAGQSRWPVPSTVCCSCAMWPLFIIESVYSLDQKCTQLKVKETGFDQRKWNVDAIVI